MDILFHYTSFDCLRSILKGIRQIGGKRYLTLWASSVYEMDDQMEMNYGYPFIQSVVNDYENKISLTLEQRMDKCVREIPNFISGPNDKFFLPKKKTPFVLSFTQSWDSSFMWDKYGDQGKGICLALDANKLQKESERANSHIANIAYLKDKAYDYEIWKSLYDSVVNEIKKVHVLVPFLKVKDDVNSLKQVVLETLCPLVSVLIKGSDFEKEQEVRWFSIADGNRSKLREKNGTIVSFVEIPIPLDCLVGIGCGPCFANGVELTTLCTQYQISLTKSTIRYNY